MRIFENSIPMLVRATEASVEGVGIYEHDPKGKVAGVYQSLTKELLDKLAEYKPLAKVEEIEEQNYNQIENVLNNGFEQKKKELVVSEPEKPAPEKEKNKIKGEEIS